MLEVNQCVPERLEVEHAVRDVRAAKPGGVEGGDNGIVRDTCGLSVDFVGEQEVPELAMMCEFKHEGLLDDATRRVAQSQDDFGALGLAVLAIVVGLQASWLQSVAHFHGVSLRRTSHQVLETRGIVHHAPLDLATSTGHLGDELEQGRRESEEEVQPELLAVWLVDEAVAQSQQVVVRQPRRKPRDVARQVAERGQHALHGAEVADVRGAASRHLVAGTSFGSMQHVHVPGCRLDEGRVGAILQEVVGREHPLNMCFGGSSEHVLSEPLGKLVSRPSDGGGGGSGGR